MLVLEGWYFRGTFFYEIKVEEMCFILIDVEGGCFVAVLGMENEGCIVIDAELIEVIMVCI